jgi:hypothetical protein
MHKTVRRGFSCVKLSIDTGKFLIGLLLLIVTASTATAENDVPDEILMHFVDAYNRHDVAEMLDLVADDVRTMGIIGESMSVWSTGKEQLASMLADNFKNTPTNRSVILDKSLLGNFVTAVEQAVWEAGGETKSQCAVAVYEIESGLIRNVWYFAEQPCNMSADEIRAK